MRDSPRILAPWFLVASCFALPASAAEPTSQAEDERRVDLTFDAAVGPVVRFGDSGIYEVTDRVGLSFAATARLSPSSLFSLGLTYEHAALGRESSGVDPIDRFDVTRDENALWATAYLHVLSSESLRLAVTVGPGVAWQSADVLGIRSGAAPWETTSFACEGSDSADLALAAGLSALMPIGDGLAFVSDARLASYGFGTDALGTCVSGIGTTATASLRVGLAYGFDVARFVK